MRKVDYSGEFEAIVETLEKVGGDRSVFEDGDASFLVVSGNRVLARNVTAGLAVEVEENEDGVSVDLTVQDDVVLPRPVHLCFGIVHKTGIQRIRSRYIIGDNSKISFIAHCSFPNAEDIVHAMDAEIVIGEHSRVRYNEVHFHGPEGGISVLPEGRISVGTNSSYFSEFKLVDGAVGIFDMNYTVDVGDYGVTELVTKLYGKKNDRIKIKESIHLNGIHSRGIAKTRIVNKESSTSEVLGEVIGNGSYSRGHVDCTEIIEGNDAAASAVPLVKVTNPLAKVTHEAAIGSVDKNQVETLMARGLDENEAIDTIVKGILK
ncbi:MAG: SufD family Fe-S cluster assembly protein [Spirochaetes bacterium]|nr:SufD family Fe-S cluster assembly protein [Spirochaetota bacterium]